MINTGHPIHRKRTTCTPEQLEAIHAYNHLEILLERTTRAANHAVEATKALSPNSHSEALKNLNETLEALRALVV